MTGVRNCACSEIFSPNSRWNTASPRAAGSRGHAPASSCNRQHCHRQELHMANSPLRKKAVLLNGARIGEAATWDTAEIVARSYLSLRGETMRPPIRRVEGRDTFEVTADVTRACHA